ncbi:hypothetical protein N7495_009426 [Penicillium taxi]|uniref:uncharacterized protein n=1 Tax=Penicillium taxi TaxID=168475 RepID=UPI00254582B9|nr:uncharacterized protein N7495_009426 [Penicillium taxi]KAJ5884916.1 hypothetical protein N7495_009426 [Penicillium taxi]
MQSYLQYRQFGNVARKRLVSTSNSRQYGPSPTLDGRQSPVGRSEETEVGSPTTEQKFDSEALTTTNSHDQPGESAAKKEIDLSDQPDGLILVDWDDAYDPQMPKNYSYSKRLMATINVSLLGWVVGAASSINSGVSAQTVEAYHVSNVVGALVTGLYLLGFAAGSLVSGPLSEILGRNFVYVGSLSLFMIFVMATALAPNIGAQLAFRFLTGVFGCPPLTCAGGTIADLWNPLEKTLYFPMYSVISFGGPVLGPVVASYIGQTGGLSWRWTSWLILIVSGAVLILLLLFQPETYSPLLLKWKGQQFRKITGDSRYRSEMDTEKIALFHRIGGAMKRQIMITIHEPIILLISLYMTILYIVLFTFFDGYTFIFRDTYGMSQGLTNIIWVAMFVGIVLATLVIIPNYYITKKKFTQAAMEAKGADPATDSHALDGVHTAPEIRLLFAMIGAPFIPISLFWMGWTDYASISVWSPIVASMCFGFGTICIFISSYMYVIDSYEIYAASALGFMTVSRYCAAGIMAIVGIPFYQNVGVHYTLTILGCISAVMVPVPYVFYKYGPVIRRWSRYAMTEDVKV